MFDRRLATHFDWSFAATILGMALVGILTIYSANTLAGSTFRKTLYLRQLTWVGVGLVGLVVACLVSYRTLARFAYVIFGLSGILLVLVLILGKAGLGAQRWIRVAGFAFQPSEFAKLGLVLFLARYFDDHRDLGLNWRRLVPFIVGGGVLAPLLWMALKEYQRRRILVFLNPDLDPLGAGYHIAQSKIAVGSGGAFGKGWLAASQSQLNFLPLNHTDFIFAVLSEQWGFLGSLAVLLAYFYLITKGFQIARDCTDLFAALLAAGVSAMLAIQVLINIAMVVGMMPVVGIPLP
ncbi:MAG: rod shape-determining protein RodA, partial [candidate division NC10 bacterium]|nr:rod shape-determining protein RodA [candidate division NC10 bacterium]